MTLARRLDPAALGTALTLLGGAPDAAAIAARLWDSAEKRITDLH